MEHRLSIERYLTERTAATLFREDTRRALAAGDPIELAHAFLPGFAEPLHAAIDRADAWMPVENYRNEGFAYRYHRLRDALAYPEVRACHAVFDSEPTKGFMADVTGRHCPGPIQFGITRYLPGDYATPHTDLSDAHAGARAIAFLWYLTRDWRPKWGGELHLQGGRALCPAFNTLVLFLVSSRSRHFVTPVSPFATGKRLTVTGWWTNSLEAPAAS
jgi:hypothetical protein